MAQVSESRWVRHGVAPGAAERDIAAESTRRPCTRLRATYARISPPRRCKACEKSTLLLIGHSNSSTTSIGTWPRPDGSTCSKCPCARRSASRRDSIQTHGPRTSLQTMTLTRLMHRSGQV